MRVSPAWQLVFATMPLRGELSSELAVHSPGEGQGVWDQRELPLGLAWTTHTHTQQFSKGWVIHWHTHRSDIHIPAGAPVINPTGFYTCVQLCLSTQV